MANNSVSLFIPAVVKIGEKQIYCKLWKKHIFVNVSLFIFIVNLTLNVLNIYEVERIKHGVFLCYFSSVFLFNTSTAYILTGVGRRRLITDNHLD